LKGALEGDYSLFQTGGPNARVGSWDGVIRQTLADWQTASGQGANSLVDHPLFVDENGSDNMYLCDELHVE